jgi:DNA-binding CsgD family transcriptional regulator
MEAIARLVRDENTVRDLGEKLIACALEVSRLDAPETVLDQLGFSIDPCLDLKVLGATRFPRRASDWPSLALGRSVFLHREAPRGWWQEWSANVHHHIPVGYMMARAALAPHTSGESLRALEPIGADRWGYEVAYRHGIRDWLACPVGGRWLVVFWSNKPLSRMITPRVKVMLYAAASFTAMRLEQLVGPDIDGSKTVHLTARERSVMRLLSHGMGIKEAAAYLDLGEETVRTHAKNAQVKLGARNRSHAVAEAIRQHIVM